VEEDTKEEQEHPNRAYLVFMLFLGLCCNARHCCRCGLCDAGRASRFSRGRGRPVGPKRFCRRGPAILEACGGVRSANGISAQAEPFVSHDSAMVSCPVSVQMMVLPLVCIHQSANDTERVAIQPVLRESPKLFETIKERGHDLRRWRDCSFSGVFPKCFRCDGTIAFVAESRELVDFG